MVLLFEADLHLARHSMRTVHRNSAQRQLLSLE